MKGQFRTKVEWNRTGEAAVRPNLQGINLSLLELENTKIGFFGRSNKTSGPWAYTMDHMKILKVRLTYTRDQVDVSSPEAASFARQQA